MVRIFRLQTTKADTNPVTFSGPIRLKYQRIIHIYGIPDHLLL